jgi:hypothetical protein
VQKALYKVKNGNCVFIKFVEVSDTVRHDDSWLKEQGYDSSFLLRRGKIIEVSQSERKALSRTHDLLKQRGLLPSAKDTIMQKLSS